MKNRFFVRTVLDYGCGHGCLKEGLRRSLDRLHLGQVSINEYDPCVPDKKETPKPADFVVCTDVLEHIEPACLNAVLADLYRVTAKFAFIGIALRESQKVLPDGRNAHLITKPAGWWAKKLRNVGKWEVNVLPTARNTNKYVALTVYK